jgi:hypothetical protein
MNQERVRLPDGTQFKFWDDRTKYRRVYHVAQRHPSADDDNPGSEKSPFATISRAAEVLNQGEKVVVHEGVYREWVRPARGGDGADRMIAYEAAKGERVVIRASEIWKNPGAQADWQSLSRAGKGVWTAVLPSAWFIGHNPLSETNLSHLSWFPWQKRTQEELKRALLKRGQIFQDGRRLRQVPALTELKEPGTFWVRDPGLQVAVHLYDDADPAAIELEVSTRAQCFAPVRPRLGHIRVSGFTMEHAANGVPMPQYGTLATTEGHHWIIENNTVRHANTLGIDIGWRGDGFSVSTKGDTAGGNTVRRNRIAHCGMSGVCGTWGTDDCLVEDNLIEHIGELKLEHCYEAAGIKLHFAHHTLVRRNVIRHMDEACGIWMDCACAHNRLQGNVIADVSTVLAGIYIEANPEPNLVDGNVVWDLRDGPNNIPPKDGIPGGNGISVDVSDGVTVANNFLGRIQGHYAVAVHLAQKDRVTNGRSAMCRGENLFGNMFVECPKRVRFARTDGNTCDGNLYDERKDGASFGVEEVDRIALLDLVGWRRFLGFDLHGGQASIEATLDVERMELTLTVKGAPRAAVRSDRKGVLNYAGPGPFDRQTWARLRTGKPVTIRVLSNVVSSALGVKSLRSDI